MAKSDDFHKRISRSTLIEKLKQLEVKRHLIPEELVRSLPSQESDVMLYDQEPVGSEPSIFLEHRTDLCYQLNRFKVSKLHFKEIKSVKNICKLLNAHGDSFDERINYLRDMHQSMALKKQVLKALTEEEILHAPSSRKVNSKTVFRWVYSIFLNFLVKLSHSLKLIYPSVNRPVKVYFGSELVSFFIFCWWFCYMNMFNFLIVLFFIVIPQHAYTKFTHDPRIIRDNTEFSIRDIFKGKGWFINSTFYYTGYTNKTFELFPGMYYNMPMAYVLTISVILLFNFFAVVYAALSYFGAHEAIGNGQKYTFSKVLFSYWDFTTSVKAVADFMKQSFYEEMQGLLDNEVGYQLKPLLSRIYKTTTFLVINFFVFMLIAGSCVAMLTLLYIKDLKEYYSLVVSLMLTIVPVVFYNFLKFLERYEYYLSKKAMLYISMIRLFVLRIVLMGIVIFFWVDVFETNSNTCHQTELSASFFRLLVGNFGVQILVFNCISEYVRRKLIDSFRFPWNKSHFDLAYHAVDIIYYQFLGWVGLLWFPLIPLLNSVVLYLLLFLKANSILKNCRPAKVMWSSGELDECLLMMTLATFVCSVVFTGYSLIRMGSSSCGPFRVWSEKVALLERVLVWKPYTLPYRPTFSDYAWSPMILLIFFMGLCAVVALVRSYALSRIALTGQVEEELKLSVDDNAFLLHGLAEILKSESEDWKCKEKAPSK